MMTPEKIQSVTVSYDQKRTLSEAVSNDPARNDILRLDVMMSREPDGPILIGWLYVYQYSLTFILLQIVGVSSTRSHSVLIGLFTLSHVLQSAATRVVRCRSVQSGCLSCDHVVRILYVICNNRVASIALVLQFITLLVSKQSFCFNH